jgi:hypothetical protein
LFQRGQQGPWLLVVLAVLEVHYYLESLYFQRVLIRQ